MPRPLIAILLSALAFGCGYSLVGGGGPAAGEPRTIAVPLFENRSAEPGFERMLADALSEEFARRGELRPVWDERSAPNGWALRGVVRAVRVVPSAFSSVGLALESRVEAELEISLVRGPDRELVWRHDPLLLAEVFLSSADAQVGHTNREQALRRLASETAGRIHDELSQTF